MRSRVTSQAVPSVPTSWKRARLLAVGGSHQRSSAGHGPAQAAISTGGRPASASRAGRPVTTNRSVTPTGTPASSVTSAGTGTGSTVAGDGAGNRPGQGGSVGRSGTRSSPHATSRIWSPGSRPPSSTAVSTRSGPSMPCTRASTRPARSSASPIPPQSPSCIPPYGMTSSGTSRSRTMPAVGRS